LFIRNTGSIASSQSLNVLTGTIFNLSFATAPVTVQNVSGDPGSFIQLDSASLTCQITNSLTTVASTITDTGAGELIKTGAGTLELSGMSTYPGPTTVSQGVLFVSENGQIQSPVTVLSGGKLKGTGVILSDVIINGGGSIQAGGSIGDFSIDSLTLAGGSSILELDIDLTAGSSLSSRYLVSGPVALNGAALQLNFVTTTGAATDHTYEFIEFVGGDPGVFGSITSVPGYTSEVIISPNLITLKLTVLPTPPPPPPTPSIGAGVSLSPNQRAVLSYLLAFQSVPALHSLFQGLAALSPDQLRAALDSISPARNAASTFFSNQVAFDIEKISLSRLRDGRILGRIGERKETKLSAALATKSETLLAMNSETVMFLPPVADDEVMRPAGRSRTAAAKSDRMSFWTTGFGDFLSQAGQNSNPHIHDTASGAVLGFDYYGAKNGLFTISAGYLHNNITEGRHAGSGTSNGAVLSIYSTGYLGNSYLEAGALGGYNRFDMQRRVTYGGPTPFNGLAKSSYNNWVAVPHLGGGYDWMMKWGVVEPFASLDWAVSFQESYREKGASPLNMKSRSQTPNILRSQVGLNVYETWDNETSTFIFEQSGSYVNKAFFHTNMNSAIVIAPTAVPAGAPSSFTVLTYDKTLNLGSVGLELFYKHKRSGFFLSGNYQGEFGSRYMSNEVTGTLGVFF
jgi:autotransporter-associated beta strand protein